MTPDELRERRAQMKRELDEFVQSVNREIAFKNGQIALLDSMIAEMESKAEGPGGDA